VIRSYMQGSQVPGYRTYPLFARYRYRSFQAVLRIRDVYTGSIFSIPDPEYRVSKIPDPGSASKNLSIFNPKTNSSSQNRIQDVHTGTPDSVSGFVSILIPYPDPGAKKAPNLGFTSMQTT
jgi:hypothetical protein